MNLKFADGLSLPPDAVTQKFAFLGRSGSGKTYACGRLVESMLRRNDQVVVFDPVGVWWGLRLSANGADEGYEIAVFGGEQGDVPIYPENGSLVAQTIVLNNISAVVDVSQFRKADRIRFMTDFGEEFFQLKKKRRSPVHLVLEEAQVFCPQFVKGLERMVGTMEDIIKLGRNYGIGVSLVSQRPQSVNKDVLNQSEVLVVLQTTGPQERKAIRGWIVEAGLDVQDLVDELPALGRHRKGEAFVWSPSWLGITKRVVVEKKETYDASRTPSAAVRRRAAKALSEDDLEALRESMKAAVEKAKQDDPTQLRKEVAELNRVLRSWQVDYEKKDKELAAAQDALRKRPEPMRVKQVTPSVPKRVVKKIEAIAKFAQDSGKVLTELQTLNGLLTKLVNPVYHYRVDGPRGTVGDLGPPDSETFTPLGKVFGGPVKFTPRKVKVAAKLSPDNPMVEKYKPTGGAKRMLEALVQYGSPMSRRKIALVSRIKTTGGSFGTYLSALKTAGYIVLDGDDVGLTPLGESVVPDVQPIAKEQLISSWRSQFTGGAKRMFDFLVSNQNEWVSREELGRETNMDVNGGSFGTYLSKLRTSGVIEVNDNGVRLHPDLHG
jgi:GTPase SAR1 family protein